MSGHVDNLENARETLLVGASPRRYICEVQRDIYDFIEKNVADPVEREQGLNLTAEAFWAGKRMSDRLVELKVGWDKNDWAPNLNFDDDLYRRAARLNLLQHIRSVNIETIDWCNRKCSWCPNKDRITSPKNLMPLDVYTRILRQLKDYMFTGEVHPFLRGEPTMDARLPELISFCKKILPDCLVVVMSNGDGIRTQSAIEEFFEAGTDKIHMNHYDGALSTLGKGQDSRYPGLFHYGMAALEPSFYNRAGSVDRTPTKKHVSKNGRCDWFMHKLAFTYQGELILCCSDFDGKIVFGNIMKNPLASILGSQLYRQYYYAHKEGRGKEMPMCKECNRLT